jgi:hypothetical protein
MLRGKKMVYRSCIFLLASVVAAATASCGSIIDIGGVYVAQTPAGDKNGRGCSNARALGDLTPADWVPGNTIHLCGTITFPAGSAGLVAQGSGTASSPIIVKFEPNAVLEAPYFPFSTFGTCGSLLNCAAGIELFGYNYIIVDGGASGIVENTANGTNLANHQPSAGMIIYGSNNIIVRNLTIKNIYVNDPTQNDTAGTGTDDIAVLGGSTNVAICNNHLDNARVGIGANGLGSTVPSYPLPSCSSNTFLTGQNIFANELGDHAWTMQVGTSAATTTNIFNNTFNFALNWVDSLDDFHNDGIITAGMPSTLYIFNNIFQGPFAGTGETFCTYSIAGSGSSCYIFNNLYVQGTANVNTGIPIYLNLGSGYNLGPYYVFNNTAVGFGDGILGYGPLVELTSENNLFSEGTTAGDYFYSQGSPGITNQVFVASDHNSFYGGRGLSFTGAGNYYGWPTGNWNGYKSWTTTGFDTHSISGNPLLTGTYTLGAGSPDIQAGANLSSLCATPGLGPLCYDKNGVARPLTGPWDLGAFQSPGSNAPTGSAVSVK